MSAPHFPPCWESRPPRLAPRSGQGSAEGSAWWGPLSRTRLAWRPHPALFLGTCPMATQGCTGPSQSSPHRLPLLSSQQRHLEDSPRSPCHSWTGCPHSKRDPQSRGITLPGGPVSSLCVWEPRGDSWGVRQPSPGCTLLGGGYWERCFPGASMGPGGKAGGGGSCSALHPQIRSPRTRTPQPTPFLSQETGSVSSGGPQGLVPGQQAQMVLGALGPGSDLILPPTGPGPGPTVGQLHSSSLQPPKFPPGHNIPGRALPVLSSPFPRLRDQRGAPRPHTAPAPVPRPALRPGPPLLTLPHPVPAHGVGATRGASGPGTCLPPCPKATWVQWSGHVERAHIHRPGPWGAYPGPGILPRRKQAGRPCRGRHVHRPCA